MVGIIVVFFGTIGIILIINILKYQESMKSENLMIIEKNLKAYKEGKDLYYLFNKPINFINTIETIYILNMENSYLIENLNIIVYKDEKVPLENCKIVEK